MPEKAGNDGDESWAQTLITITPEEDAAIRTITESTVISALGDTPLVLGVDQIAERRTVQVNTIRRNLFIEDAELEENSGHSDAGCQTFLQGVPKVELPSIFKDEATQTMYLGNDAPYAVLKRFRDMTRIMNDRVMPVSAKVTQLTQTVIKCGPNEPRKYIVDRLANGITPEELLEDNFTQDEGTTCVTDNLHFILDRVFWLSDPDYRVPKVELKDEAAQTCIKYDHGLRKVVLDADTQTSLTCEPSRSNTGLLSEWSAMKEFAQKIIDECLETGVYPRTVVHSILDEIVDRCAGQIHLPYKDKTVQTLAPCNALQDKDDEVLRKLRLGLVLDTLESSVIVLPLVQILLENACTEVRQKAPAVAAEILNRIQRNSVTIAVKLAAIRQEAVSHKPMDDIFEARKKRLKELLRDKTGTKLCSSTQTELAGVPDIVKIKEPKETICSTCVRHSECEVCEAILGDEKEEPENGKRRDIVRGKILRTQDILIAYNPCYLVTTPSKIPKIHPPIVPRRLPVASIPSKRPRPRLSKADLPVFASSSTSCRSETEPRRLDDVCPPKGFQATSSSLNDWARVAQESSSIYGAWSVRGSISTESSAVPKQVGSSGTCPSRKPPTRKCARSRCSLSARSDIQALRILKGTFNRNEESCSDCSSYEDEKLETLTAGLQERLPAAGTTSSNSDNREDRPHGEGVRIVPIIHVANQIDEK